MSPPAFFAPRTVQRPAVGGPQDQPAVGRLAAAARVEHGPVEDDERRVAAVVDRDDPGLDRPGVGVRVAELAGGIHPTAP